MTGKNRNGKLELLRFLFSVIVMLLHAGNIPGFENRLFKTGAFSVEFFFLISGYLMMGSIERSMTYPQQESIGKETFRFLRKKSSGYLSGDCNFLVYQFWYFCIG